MVSKPRTDLIGRAARIRTDTAEYARAIIEDVTPKVLSVLYPRRSKDGIVWTKDIIDKNSLRSLRLYWT